MGGAINEKTANGNLNFRRFGVRHFYRVRRHQHGVGKYSVGKHGQLYGFVFQHAVGEHVGISRFNGHDRNGSCCG